MERIKEFFIGLKNRVDFKFHPITLLPLLILLLTLPACLWLPIEYSYENHLIENFQLVVILAIFIICIKAKNDKTFFNTLALVMVILFLREINCGRTVFFHVPGGGITIFTLGRKSLTAILLILFMEHFMALFRALFYSH